jgi:gluconolactonase
MMKKIIIGVISLSSALISHAQSTIPQGEIRGPFSWKSKIYPGTERDYWIYVPRQYDATKPACTMVVQDGLGFAKGVNIPRVLDSLIEKKDIPVIIGIFIDHGKVVSAGSDNYPRFNRSFEYDGMGNRYARFLLEEILPEVAKTYTLSSDPNDRSIAGASSGAICAFNAAWERPDSFHRVMSSIGTYVGLRGADEFATLVRKTEPKPLRVFLEDGNHDLNIYAGDWWVANQGMLSALTWAGYEVNHQWGEGGHSGAHTKQILADALVWLWKDYPTPVKTHVNPKGLSLTDEPWRKMTLVNSNPPKLAVNQNGEILFKTKNLVSGKDAIYKINEAGKVSLVNVKLTGTPNAFSVDSSGKLYVGDQTHRKINLLDEKGNVTALINNVDPEFLTTSGKGIYFTEKNKDRVGYYSFQKKEVNYFSVSGSPTGLALSADQTFLSVGLSQSVFGYSFKVNTDGTLEFGQDYIHYHIPYGQTTPGTQGMAVDANNMLYSATAMGIQVSDQLGRINYIFSPPDQPIVDVKLGGHDFNILYIVTNNALYTRKINAKGVLSINPAVKPPRPGL